MEEKRAFLSCGARRRQAHTGWQTLLRCTTWPNADSLRMARLPETSCAAERLVDGSIPVPSIKSASGRRWLRTCNRPSASSTSFANAGVAYGTPLSTTSEAQYDRLMDTNVKSAFFSIQAVEPIMREGGSIIMTTAWLNQVGLPGRAVLSASKAAVRSFARTMSAELLGRCIRVKRD